MNGDTGNGNGNEDGNGTENGNGNGNGEAAAAVPRLDLERFFPYRVAQFYDRVSQSLARRYMALFDITVPEWRILAVLGSDEPRSAGEIGHQTKLDKVQVSRAVQRLKASGLVSRRIDRADRRRARLRLTAKGLGVYGRIVPLAADYEERLLEVLTAEERALFDSLMERLADRAAELDAEARQGG